MAEIKAVRLPGGDWQLLDQMTEAEVAAYSRQLARELAAGRAVLAELEDYVKRRWGTKDGLRSETILTRLAADSPGDPDAGRESL